MSKRPSVIGGLNLPGTEARGSAADVSSEQARAAPPAGRVRPEVVHTSVYLPREVHRRLREIAFTRDCKVHDVIMEGIDAALQKHGHPSVEALRGSRTRSE
ncbi:hypothetical protein [Methylobacterium oxalidis]|uniref:Chromosome partitioning protein ParB n=1 Tax=Methylobacterium oxalidis TaxID=944322 RepID=A0A512JCP9_9HYPH|nr:hypothetical protein [Methylobacterium oxalidis]GEP07754.1 hypothetical protein MOX02_57920 [Methylobacterium oxalidis]GJE35069.1 hypothetical protein LDDCCGHA_5287 [Methylobacterium oxalidis]GLS65800.1 hypothetical protein GCM10007888_41820 [Methylobacterium oxalidis]